MKNFEKIQGLKKAVFTGALFAASVLAPSLSHASGSTDFSNAKDTVQDWITGDLGVTIATAGGIWGMIAAVAGNIKMAALGVGIAAVAALTTPVIDTLFTATI
jgi:hypothetical protein